MACLFHFLRFRWYLSCVRHGVDYRRSSTAADERDSRRPQVIA